MKTLFVIKSNQKHKQRSYVVLERELLFWIKDCLDQAAKTQLLS